jgi:hypothetical protein
LIDTSARFGFPNFAAFAPENLAEVISSSLPVGARNRISESPDGDFGRGAIRNPALPRIYLCLRIRCKYLPVPRSARWRELVMTGRGSCDAGRGKQHPEYDSPSE